MTTPGVFMSTSRTVRPLCLGIFGSVRTTNSHASAVFLRPRNACPACVVKFSLPAPQKCKAVLEGLLSHLLPIFRNIRLEPCAQLVAEPQFFGREIQIHGRNSFGFLASRTLKVSAESGGRSGSRPWRAEFSFPLRRPFIF